MGEQVGAGRGVGLRSATRAHPRLVVTGVAAAFAVIVAAVPPLTWPASVVSLAVGTVMVILLAAGWPARVGTTRHADGRGVLPWAVQAAAFTVGELSAFLSGSRPDFPTLSALMSPLFLDPAVRALGYLAWLGTGYWLLQR